MLLKNMFFRKYLMKKPAKNTSSLMCFLCSSSHNTEGTYT